MATETNIKKILVLQGPNLNLLGLLSKSSGGNLTLDKVNRALRRKARELDVQLKIIQSQDEVEASKVVQRQRNKIGGILLIPGIWAVTGHLLKETLQITNTPLSVYHFHVKGAPWSGEQGSIMGDIAAVSSAGDSVENLINFLGKFVTTVLR